MKDIYFTLAEMGERMEYLPIISKFPPINLSTLYSLSIPFVVGGFTCTAYGVCSGQMAKIKTSFLPKGYLLHSFLMPPELRVIVTREYLRGSWVIPAARGCTGGLLSVV